MTWSVHIPVFSLVFEEFIPRKFHLWKNRGNYLPISPVQEESIQWNWKNSKVSLLFKNFWLLSSSVLTCYLEENSITIRITNKSLNIGPRIFFQIRMLKRKIQPKKLKHNFKLKISTNVNFRVALSLFDKSRKLSCK